MLISTRPLAQGEIEFWEVSPDHFDGEALEPLAPNGPHLIVAHSESGHHHVLDRELAKAFVVKRPESDGFRMLKIIVEHPADVKNLAPAGHKELTLQPGVYLGIVGRELGLDDMIRRSAD